MFRFDPRWIRDYGAYFQMGLIFPAAILVGWGFGWLIDRWLPTEPWGQLGGIFFGVITGFVNFIRDLQRIQRKKS